MAFRRFEDLRIYQLAEQLADNAWDIVKAWGYFEKETIGKQFVRAVDSIGANIAEGAGRGTPKENQRFIRISRGSLNEAKYWLERAHQRNLIGDKDKASIKERIDELGPGLNAYLKSFDKTKKNL